MVDGETGQEKTYEFPAGDVLRTDVTADQLEPGFPQLPMAVTLPRIQPLSLGPHTRELVWVLSCRVCLDAIARLGTRAWVGSTPMLRLLRLALQFVLFFLLLSLVVAVGSAQTGLVEKVALIAAGVVLVWLASFVRRIGWPPEHHA